MNQQALSKLLQNFDKPAVDDYIKYCFYVLNDTKSGGQEKNPWMKNRSDQQLADCFIAVVKDGLPFDGKHITLQSTGISYDYVAFKNKMLLAYP